MKIIHKTNDGVRSPKNGYVRVATIFIENQDRPMFNGDLLNDFKWRRTHESLPVDADLFDKVKSVLTEEGYDAKKMKMKYSRNAGCTTCPCSPGFIVTIPKSSAGNHYTFWVRK